VFIQQSLQQSASILVLRQQVDMSLQLVDAALRCELGQEFCHGTLVLSVAVRVVSVMVPMVSMVVTVMMAVMSVVVAVTVVAAVMLLPMTMPVVLVAVSVAMTATTVLLQVVVPIEMRLHRVAIETVVLVVVQSRCTSRSRRGRRRRSHQLAVRFCTAAIDSHGSHHADAERSLHAQHARRTVHAVERMVRVVAMLLLRHHGRRHGGIYSPRASRGRGRRDARWRRRAAGEHGGVHTGRLIRPARRRLASRNDEAITTVHLLLHGRRVAIVLCMRLGLRLGHTPAVVLHLLVLRVRHARTAGTPHAIASHHALLLLLLLLLSATATSLAAHHAALLLLLLHESRRSSHQATLLLHQVLLLLLL
jgi:hypothetical protein